MLEVAYILVALALIVFLVYLIITVQKLGRVIDETEKTIKTLTSDVDVTLHHTNELLAKVNVLADDINVKVATIDPLFSESMSRWQRLIHSLVLLQICLYLFQTSMTMRVS